MREDAATAELTRDGTDERLKLLYRGIGFAYMYVSDAETEEVSDAQGFACITERGGVMAMICWGSIRAICGDYMGLRC